jgi:AcrR family transcriptional regulator
LATRAKLLEAAHSVFETHSYSGASVDLIVDKAGVSRTTFYRHFDGKLPVAIALFEKLEPVLTAEWQRLLRSPVPSRPEIQRWIVRQLEILDADKTLISTLRHVDATEQAVQARILTYHNVLMDMVWEGTTIGQEDTARTNSLLFLLQVDEFFYSVCARNWQIDRAAMINAMAGLFQDFLRYRDGVRA